MKILNYKNNKMANPSQPSLTKGRRVAFTVAEVLITLGIIGVVSALTLPSVIQKYNETTTGLELCIQHSYALNQDFELDDVYDLIRATYHNFFQQSNTK